MSIVSIAKILIVWAILVLTGCASTQWPQDYYASRNTGDRIASSLKLGMTMDEIRAIVSNSDYKGYVQEGPLASVATEDEILSFYSNVHYPRDILDSLQIGTPYRSFRYWITAHSNVAIYLFFDASDRLRGWANYPSNATLARYRHERLTSRLKIKTERPGMTRAEVYALLGPPKEVIDLPKQRSRAQHVDHFWNAYAEINRAPVRDLVKQLEIYTHPIGGGEQRRVFVGYTPVPSLLFQYDWKLRVQKQVPNPNYVEPQNDALTLWGYDHAWEEGERYLSTQEAHRK